MSRRDDRVGRVAMAWGLTVGALLVGGTDSAVYEVVDRAGRDLVLKCPNPDADAAAVTAVEATALSVWASTGATVTLVAAAPEALLLARARPGVPWPWTPSGPPEEVAGIAAGLLGRLWAAPRGAYAFLGLADSYPLAERVARRDAAFEQQDRGEPDRGAAGLARLPAAAAAADHLMNSCTAPRLLHGDFISKNIVSDDRSPLGWVTLDPQPMVGDPAAEVGFFAAYQPVEVILPIAEALARASGQDVGRSLKWAAIWTVHQAAQSWRDDQSQLEHLVASPGLEDLLRPEP